MGHNKRSTWGMKDEEYIADFCLVSKRTLTHKEHRLFRYHYFLGADWKLCCMRLGMERGEFFHEIYRIEQKLGRTFRELKPHALFPVDEYFNGTGRYDRPSLVEVLTRFEEAHAIEEAAAVVEGKKRRKNVLKFPIRKAA